MWFQIFFTTWNHNFFMLLVLIYTFKIIFVIWFNSKQKEKCVWWRNMDFIMFMLCFGFLIIQLNFDH
jgi:hypothetical protein